MRISRPCYDKFHRCPGWAGGGVKYAKRGSRCEGGHIAVDYDARLWKWRLWRCGTCDVVVLPYLVRWLDFGWWRWVLTSSRRFWR